MSHRTLSNIAAELKSFIAESTGVSGFHLNGEIMSWDDVLDGPLGTLGRLLNNPPILAEFTFEHEWRIDNNDNCDTEACVIRYLENGICEVHHRNGIDSARILYNDDKKDSRIMDDVYTVLNTTEYDTTGIYKIIQSI